MIIELQEISCPTCGVIFYIPKSFDSRMRECHNNFYCPKGHSQSYPQKTTEDILRSQLQEAKKKIKLLTSKKMKGK